MAGYCGFSMSNNAVAAYREGLVPASKVGNGIPAALIREHCRYAEWHHTSKHFNATEFYDPEYVKGFFGVYGSDHEEFNEHAAAAFNDYKAARKSKDQGKLYNDCRVDWLEWSGSMRRRRCTEQSAEGCIVRVKGQTAYIKFGDGTAMTKLLTTNGFSFTAEYTTHLRNIAKAAKEREKEKQRAVKERCARLSRTIKRKPASSGRAWAAMTPNGRMVLGIMEMRHYGDYGYNEGDYEAMSFQEYRDSCKELLAKRGIVVSGYYDAEAGTYEICERDITLFPARTKKTGHD